MSLGCLRLRFLDLNDPYYEFSDEDFADSFMDEVNEGNSIGRWGLGVSREAFSLLQGQEAMIVLKIDDRYH